MIESLSNNHVILLLQECFSCCTTDNCNTKNTKAEILGADDTDEDSSSVAVIPSFLLLLISYLIGQQ